MKKKTNIESVVEMVDNKMWDESKRGMDAQDKATRFDLKRKLTQGLINSQDKKDDEIRAKEVQAFKDALDALSQLLVDDIKF